MYLGVEPLIPLVFGEVLLMKNIKIYFLFIPDGEWILIFCVVQDGLPNKDHEFELIIACACVVPIRIMLHPVHQYLGAMTSHN